MDHHEIPRLVKEALVEIGCDASLISDLDAHSPIELTFKESPNIYVEPTPEGAWFQARIEDCTEESLLVRAEKLWRVTSVPVHYADCGFLAVGLSDSELVIKVRLTESAVADVTHFGEALTDFYERVALLSEIMRQ